MHKSEGGCSLMKIQYSYQIVQQTITIFCWLSMMKLRHKKPLNPYKGQTNNDKNEFNDDDFRQQTSPHKKNGGTPTDQVYKYARILSKFVKTINQDYRFVIGQGMELQLPHSPERPLSKSKQQTHPQREPLFTKKQQLRQLKQMPKLQNKIEPKEDKKQSSYTTRKRENQQVPPTTKQPRNSSTNLFSNPQISQNVAQTLGKTSQQLKMKDNSRISAQKKDQINPNLQFLGANVGNNSKINANPASVNPQPGQSTTAPINFQNFMNMPNLPPNFQGMIHPNQVLSLMNMGALNGLNPMQLSLFMRNYNQSYMYGGLPVGMNMNNLAMMGMGLNNMPNNQRFMLNPEPKINLFSQQVKAFKSIQESTPKDNKVAYPLKRAAFHIAISYKIYLDKLKQDGHSIENLDDIDPTKHARRIKSSQQQQSKNAKDLNKKKK